MYRILHFDTITSTNRYAIEHLDQFADGDIISASFQTHGRGRLGRSWLSDDPRNICMSIVLKPSGAAEDLPLSNITQYLSIAVCRAAAEFGVSCQIKWPNDIFIDGRKACGILSEASFSGTQVKGIVAGVGINLNSYPAEREIGAEATSFAQRSGKSIDRNLFLFRVLDRFFKDYDSFLSNGFRLIRNEYLSRFLFLDREISLTGSGVPLAGKAVDIAEDGKLVLEDYTGTRHLVASGEIILQPGH